MNPITPEVVVFGVLWYIAFLFSTTCHEAAHALAAKLGGDDTAYLGGQVSLSPLPHIEREPFGMVILPIASYFLFGWMMGVGSAPYDPIWQHRHPRRAALMALAGPAANFLIMLLAASGIWLGVYLGHFKPPAAAGIGGTNVVAEAVNPEQLGFLATFLGILFILNLILGTFNLLPLPPLDGHVGATLAMPRATALRIFEFGQDRSFQLIGMILAWYLYGKVVNVIFRAGLLMLYPGSSYTFT